MEPAQLLYEAGHPRVLALRHNAARPGGIEGSMTWAALTANNDPVKLSFAHRSASSGLHPRRRRSRIVVLLMPSSRAHAVTGSVLLNAVNRWVCAWLAACSVLVAQRQLQGS